MTSLLSLLEDIVDADFGTFDLVAVRRILGGRGDDATPCVQARQLLDTLSTVQRRSRADVYIWAGNRLAAPVVNLLPQIGKLHTSTRTMLLQMTHVAQLVARELVPDSQCPDFWEDFLDADTIRISFDGPQEVAWILEGAVAGLGVHFGERVDVTRPEARIALVDRRHVDVKVMQERRSVRPNRGLSVGGGRS